MKIQKHQVYLMNTQKIAGIYRITAFPYQIKMGISGIKLSRISAAMGSSSTIMQLYFLEAECIMEIYS
jgi:hypothetical protein